jgi:hypothetical protein
MFIKPGMCVKYNCSKRWKIEYGVVVSKKIRGDFIVMACGYLYSKIKKVPYKDMDIVNLKNVVSTDQIECINYIGMYNVANIQYLLRLKTDIHQFHENMLLTLRCYPERLERIFNKDYIKQNCFWEDTYRGKEEEFMGKIADAVKISNFKDVFYFDGTINRGTN